MVCRRWCRRGRRWARSWWRGGRAGRRLVNAYGPTETTVCATMTGPLSAGWRGGDRVADREYAVCLCWMSGWRRCRRGWRGSCTWPGRGWRAGMLGRPALTAERFVACPFGGARGADVPDRGPGAVEPVGVAGVRGPGRRAGEDPRVPGRAGRGRGRAGRPTRAWRRPRWWPARTRPATCGWSATSSPSAATAGLDTAADRARTPPGGCPTTWCPRRWWCWTRCRSPSTASSTALPCPRPSRPLRRRPQARFAARGDPLPGVRRGPRPARGRRRTTTSSPSAATRCWLSGSSAGSARCWASRCRVQVLFEAPTVAGLAARLDEAGRRAAGAGRRGRARSGCRCRSRQQRLWFIDQLEGPSPTYNSPGVLRLSGDLDAAALGAALRDVIEPPRGAAHRLPGRGRGAVPADPGSGRAAVGAGGRPGSRRASWTRR